MSACAINILKQKVSIQGQKVIVMCLCMLSRPISQEQHDVDCSNLAYIKKQNLHPF